MALRSGKGPLLCLSTASILCSSLPREGTLSASMTRLIQACECSNEVGGMFLPRSYTASRLHDLQASVAALLPHLNSCVHLSSTSIAFFVGSISSLQIYRCSPGLCHGRSCFCGWQCSGRHFPSHHNLPRSHLILRFMGKPGAEHKRCQEENRETAE